MVFQKGINTIKNLKRFFDIYVKKDEKRIACYQYYDMDGEALRLNYPLSNDAVVIDAGGFIGDFAADIFCKFDCYVDVFEPISSYAERIEARFQHNEKIHVIQSGLGAFEKEVAINVSGLGSSTFEMSGTAVGESEKIKIISVVDYLQLKAYPNIDLLKVNIEGGEYELMHSLLEHPRLIKKIRFFQIQFHDFVPDAGELRDEIRQRLSETHVLMWDFPFIWESWKLK